MLSLSVTGPSSGGLNNAINASTGNKQPGPPDHAKAWGWRAKQAEATAAQPPVAQVDATADSSDTTATDASDPLAETGSTSLAPDAPTGADMESVILAMINDFSETSGTDTTPLYDQVRTLFT